jgi:hypothetical protein
MELKSSGHWTAESIENFTYRIAADFLAQVETKIEAGEISRTELAHRLGRTAGRVSQLFNNPGNLTVGSAVRLVRAAGMKVALVAYDDDDPRNNDGPVNSAIFYDCWKHMGAPKTFFEFASTTAPVGNCFNTYTISGSNLTAGVSTPTSSCVPSFDACSTVTTVAGNHDVSWGYIVQGVVQGVGGVICNATNTSGPIGMKTATTAMKVTDESIPIYA